MELSAEVKPGYLSIPVIGTATLFSAHCLWFWCRMMFSSALTEGKLLWKEVALWYVVSWNACVYSLFGAVMGHVETSLLCCVLPSHQSTLWRSWQEALGFTEIQLPFWQCALAAKASAVLSWAALGKLLPAAPGGDPSPWLSAAEARHGGLGSVLAPQYRRDVTVLEK